MQSFPEKATHQQTKTFNTQLVLKAIYDHGTISRADIARLTLLTRATVSDLVAELINQGLVLEIGPGQSTGGKTPTLLSIAADSRHLIVIGQADDAFIGALVNLCGAICYRISRPLESHDGSQALKMVFELVEDLLNETDKPILGIGIGTPGLVDTSTGVVIRSINLDWINLPLGQLLSERYGLPVYVANDSQVAALAQYLYGEGPKSPNLVTIKLGQGIGSGIVLAGKLFQGDGYGAGEIGHITIVENGRLCRCGNRGCLETVATERAIVQKVRETALVDAKSSLFNQTSSPDTISAEMVFQAYQAGDALVRGVVREAAHYLGIALANLVGALNLQHIWLTGGITRYGQTWLEQIRSEMRRRSLAALANDTQVDISSLSQDVVILGTSALLLTRELGLDLTR